MLTKLGLEDIYIPAQVYDSCMAWLHMVCHVSALACAVLGLISTIGFCLAFAAFGICGSDDSESAIVCSVPAEIRFIGQGSFLLGCFPPVFWGNVENSSVCFLFALYLVVVRPRFSTNHFSAQCTLAFSVVRVLCLFSGVHSYAFFVRWFVRLFCPRSNLCDVCYVLLSHTHTHTHTHNPPLSSGYAIHHSGMGCTGNGIRCPPCTDGGATGPGL